MSQFMDCVCGEALNPDELFCGKCGKPNDNADRDCYIETFGMIPEEFRAIHCEQGHEEAMALFEAEFEERNVISEHYCYHCGEFISLL